VVTPGAAAIGEGEEPGAPRPLSGCDREEGWLRAFVAPDGKLEEQNAGA
jgi:hypothetical protein